MVPQALAQGQAVCAERPDAASLSLYRRKFTAGLMVTVLIILTDLDLIQVNGTGNDPPDDGRNAENCCIGVIIPPYLGCTRFECTVATGHWNWLSRGFPYSIDEINECYLKRVH